MGYESYQISPLAYLEEFMHVLKLPTFQCASIYKL